MVYMGGPRAKVLDQGQLDMYSKVHVSLKYWYLLYDCLFLAILSTVYVSRLKLRWSSKLMMVWAEVRDTLLPLTIFPLYCEVGSIGVQPYWETSQTVEWKEPCWEEGSIRGL